MRKLVLSALAAACSVAAFAQSTYPQMEGIVSFSGPGMENGTQPITITLNPAAACHDGRGGLLDTTGSTAALHGSYAIARTPDAANLYTLDWFGDGTVNWDATSADGQDAFFSFDAATQTFSKTITPSTYFNGAPASLAGIAFVVNRAGDIFAEGNVWSHNARAIDRNPGASGCYNFLVPFPIPFELRAGASAVKGRQNVSNLATQNSPNPFTGKTTISYNLATASEVSMKVYNMLGAEVATLVSGKQASGQHTVTFDATNATPGVYFYTTRIGNLTDTKRMVVAQ